MYNVKKGQCTRLKQKRTMYKVKTKKDNVQG